MADVSAIPFINFGESQAKQGLEQSSANLENQQAQGAAMQNQIMRARMPFIMSMYQSMAQANSDASGVEGQHEAGGPLAARQAATETNGYDADAVSSYNQKTYGVPDWTPREQALMTQAQASGDPGAIGWITTQRQQRLDLQNQQAKWKANNEYAKYAAAANSDNPREALRRADPLYSAYLDKQERDNPDIDADAMARGYAQYQAADLHRYTGRKVDYKNDQLVDQDTGLPVSGVPKLEMSTKDQAEFLKAAQTPSIEIYGPHGEPRKISPAQLVGMTPQQYLAAVAKGQAPSIEKLEAMTGGKPLTVQQVAQLKTQIRSGMGAQPNANSRAGSAAQGTTPTPTQPGAPPKDNGLLPGVDLNKLPKQSWARPADQQTGLDAAGTAANERLKAGISNEINSARQGLANNGVERNLLNRANAELNALQNNPRMVGPGSSITKALNDAYAFVSGQPPDALVDRTMLDKVLLQLGSANVRQLLEGQKITNAEFMKLLNEGNPSGHMPLGAIRKLVDFAGANNEFDRRYHATRLQAMQSGADPNSREYAELAGQRGDYVNARLGRQAEDSKPKYSDAQVRAYMKLHNLTDEKAVRKALGL